MDKFSIMTEVYDRSVFDDSVSLMITIENDKLEVTPFGGTFSNSTVEMGKEVYGLTRYLLECSTQYGGMKETADGKLSQLDKKDKT